MAPDPLDAEPGYVGDLPVAVTVEPVREEDFAGGPGQRQHRAFETRQRFRIRRLGRCSRLIAERPRNGLLCARD